MPDPVWYRSLYWRIALGFVAVLAVLLSVQAAVFLLVTGRTAAVWPGRSPAEYAQLIASDLSIVMAEQPARDLDVYLNERYPGAYRAFLVVTRDRRTIFGRRIPPSPLMARAAMASLQAAGGLGEGVDPGRGRGGRRGGGVGTGGAGGADGNAPGRGGRGGGAEAARLTSAFAPVRVAGVTVAMVAVSLEVPPLSSTLSEFGPTLAVEAMAVLLFGAAASALLVFRPARRRLSGLQSAVQAFGSGRSDVRAPEDGGDEVAQLARSFNEMAARLEERAKALAEADRTRRQLLADISHELSTPLAAIRGYVETLGMPDVPLDSATRARYLRIVNEEAERLEHMIGDLLDLAKLEGGRRECVTEPVSISQLLARVQERHVPALLDRSITLDISLSDEGLTVDGEAPRLEQALQNLASNALRHTPEGGRIRLEAHADGPEVVMVVSDTGSGIPEEHLARVFDRFYKVDISRTGTASPSGTGLGLSIVQAIVRQHRGSVTATNVPGAGASFEIRLPAAMGPRSEM